MLKIRGNHQRTQLASGGAQNMLYKALVSNVKERLIIFNDVINLKNAQYIKLYETKDIIIFEMIYISVCCLEFLIIPRKKNKLNKKIFLNSKCQMRK